MKITKLILLIAFLFNNFESIAQNFEWLRTIKGNSVANISGTVALPNGGAIVMLPVYYNGNAINDTIQIDTFTIISPNEGDAFDILVKIDSNNKVTDVIKISLFKYTWNHTGRKTHRFSGTKSICQDSLGNIYVMGYLADSINFIGTDTLNPAKGRIYFAKYDNNFKPIWTLNVGNSIDIDVNQFVESIKSSLVCSDNKLHFICLTTGTSQFGSKQFNFNSKITRVFGEISTTYGNLDWSNFIYSPTSSEQFNLTSILKHRDKIFVSGYINIGSYVSYKLINNDTFFSPGGFVIELDSIGQYKRRFMIQNGFPITINCMTSDDENLYIGGYFRDSLAWGKNVITPEYPSNQSTKWTSIYYELFTASLSASFEPSWFFRPKIIDKTAITYSSGYINNLRFQNGFLYAGGVINTEILIDSILLKIAPYWRGPLLIKFDPIGNVLWANCGGGGLIQSLSSGHNKSVFASGTFDKGIIKFGSFKDSTSNPRDAFITKITDYDITRGNVKSGPYCAGDTILVPYTHIGNFDTSNYFIAELSDKKGEFIGKQRELGRLKTNLDSVVKGILPNFEVSTSGNYRIRIRSTAPAIQSYFILDSLRLLIYSRDKADPGPADTICFMDTLQLNTFGGTKWTWSPAYFMDDATKRQPNIWPDKDTTYKIIIADSSGCGLADTAYKKVIVRPRPILFGDTLVYKCHDVNIKLKVFVKNSEFGHTVKWYRNNKLYFFNDSFTYVLNESSIFTVVLFENCSPVRDTLIIKVIYQKPAILEAILDTSVCFGSQLALTANATVNNGFAQFSWFSSSGQFIGNGTPLVTINKTDSFKVVLADNCNLKADSIWYKISLNGRIYPLQKLLPEDTVLCDASKLKLSLNNSLTNDSVIWKDVQNRQILSISKDYEITRAIFIKAEVHNICGVTSDSFNVNYLTKPIPLLDSFYSPCQSIVLPLTAGKPNNQEKYLWSNNATTAATTYNQSGNHWVQVSNTCGSEFQYFKIAFATKPKAAFNNTDVCEGQAFVLNNQSTQATGISYIWRLGDGTLDSGFAPLHTYKKTGNARTFLVSLHVASSKDCADSITLPINVNITPDASFDAAAQNKTVFFTPKNTDNQNTYKWYFGDGDSSTTKQPNHTYKADSGTYTVCLTLSNAANCSSTQCQQVHFSVSINDLKAKGIAIYPNPTNGELTIEFSSQSANSSIFLYNTLGQPIFEQHHLVSKQSLDISHLNKGVYWVNLVVDGVVWSSKVVVY